MTLTPTNANIRSNLTIGNILTDRKSLQAVRHNVRDAISELTSFDYYCDHNETRPVSQYVDEFRSHLDQLAQVYGELDEIHALRGLLAHFSPHSSPQKEEITEIKTIFLRNASALQELVMTDCRWKA